MHLIVDIRARHPEDAPIVRYAENWVHLWKKYNPHDTYTFLVAPQQLPPVGENYLIAKNDTWFSPRRRLTLSKSNEIFRCINFSRYGPYDPKVPTTTHIFDLGRWFYDNEVNANILRRKEREYMISKMLHNSKHIIVPNFSIGSELVELWEVSENKIDILPFLDMQPIESDTSIF